MSDTGNDSPSSVAENAASLAESLVTTIAAPSSTLNMTLPQVVSTVATIAGGLASVFLPGAAVAGFTISQLIGLASGVATQVPDAIAAFEEMAALAKSGQVPTAEQWASWNAAADTAHATLQAAAAAAEETATS